MPASQIGTAVSVVTAHDIAAQKSRTMADVLAAQPGLTVSTIGGVGGVTDVRIRGNDSRNTLVIIDGVEVNTTKDSSFDFSNLSPDDIERIEIIRGPMSGLYGSGAAGGVINIETKGARGPLALEARSEFGSFGTRDVYARLSGGNDLGFISASAQKRDVLGFVVAPGGTLKEGTNLTTYGLRAGLMLSPTAKLDMTLRLADKRAAITGFGDDFPSAINTLAVASDEYSTLIQRSALGGVRLSWDQLGGALTQELKANASRDVSANRIAPIFGFLGGTLSDSRDVGTRTTYGYSATYRLPASEVFGKHALTGSLQSQSETFQTISDGAYFFPFNGDGVVHERHALSGAAEWRGTFLDRLALTATGRRDVNDTFVNFNTWRTSASYDWKELGLRPHASLGTSVKLPGMYDQFGSNTLQFEANPNLRPETSRGYDVGIEETFLGGRLVLDQTYFSSLVKDQFGQFFDPANNFAVQTINLPGVSTRRGIELSSRYQITPALFLGLAYTYTDSRTPSGSPVVRVVPHGFRADVRYLFDEGRGTVAIAAVNNSRTPDNAFWNDGAHFGSTVVDLQPYWLAQIAASYKLQPNVEIYGRIENAFNANYQQVYGYQTAGFGAYAGVKIKFDDLVGAKGK